MLFEYDPVDEAEDADDSDEEEPCFTPLTGRAYLADPGRLRCRFAIAS